MEGREMNMRQLKHKRTLLIVTGCPGTGKSFWAQRIRDEIQGVDILSNDEIKERNFDLYGFDNREEKDALNARGLDEFYEALAQRMAQGGSILIEYPFYQRHRQILAGLIEKYRYRTVTLFLYGDMKAIYQRGKRRDSSGNRHPGHLLDCYHKGVTPPPDQIQPTVELSYEEFLTSCGKKNYDVRIGPTVSLDVTDLAEADAKAPWVLDEIVARS